MTQGACAGQPLLGTTIVPATQTPLYEGVLAWVTGSLTPVGLPRPLSKRLAVAISGLVMSNRATVGEVSSAVSALGVSQAKGESIARRLQRTLRDARLDPSLLPLIFGGQLPELLADQVGAHTANIGTPEWHHERFVGVVIVLDESSQEDEVHLLVAGVAFGGVVLPLAVRTWEQNVAMPVEEYWTQLTGLLLDVQQMLPAELREHVLLTADRAYGVPRMLDMLSALGWHWLLRVQGQTLVRLPDGTCRPLRQLVPRPGTQWSSGFGSAQETETAESSPVDVFKAAGWRRSQVVAVWAKDSGAVALGDQSAGKAGAGGGVRPALGDRAAVLGLEEPWLGHRGQRHPRRTAVGSAADRDSAGHAVAAGDGFADSACSTWPTWLPAPVGVCGNCACRGSRPPPRPWPAKYSLLTWGAKVAHMASRLTSTPALCWRLPLWEGRTWDQTCRHVHLTAHRQFSISP